MKRSTEGELEHVQHIITTLVIVGSLSGEPEPEENPYRKEADDE